MHRFSFDWPVIGDDEQNYYIIDDIRPTCEWIRLVGQDNLLVLPNSGLRLTRMPPEDAESAHWMIYSESTRDSILPGMVELVSRQARIW